MNKELYLSYRRIQKKVWNTENKISHLKEFLSEYEKLYEDEESKESIKRIKEYIKEQNEKLKELYPEYRKIEWQMRKTCDHEILINTSDEFPNGQHCLICGQYTINWEGQDTKTKIFIKNFHDYVCPTYFIRKFDEIVSKGEEDPFDGFVNFVKEKETKSVRILRR